MSRNEHFRDAVETARGALRGAGWNPSTDWEDESTAGLRVPLETGHEVHIVHADGYPRWGFGTSHPSDPAHMVDPPGEPQPKVGIHDRSMLEGPPEKVHELLGKYLRHPDTMANLRARVVKPR